MSFSPSPPPYNYFPDVDRFFKNLYTLNQSWFASRDVISKHQPKMKKVFELAGQMGTKLRKIEEILKDT